MSKKLKLELLEDSIDFDHIASDHSYYTDNMAQQEIPLCTDEKIAYRFCNEPGCGYLIPGKDGCQKHKTTNPHMFLHNEKECFQYDYYLINEYLCPHCKTIRITPDCSKCGSKYCGHEDGCMTLVVGTKYCQKHLTTGTMWPRIERPTFTKIL
jgi:hypothetical protein